MDEDELFDHTQFFLEYPVWVAAHESFRDPEKDVSLVLGAVRGGNRIVMICTDEDLAICAIESNLSPNLVTWGIPNAESFVGFLEGLQRGGITHVKIDDQKPMPIGQLIEFVRKAGENGQRNGQHQ